MQGESISGPALPPAGMQWLLGYRCMEFPMTTGGSVFLSDDHLKLIDQFKQQNPLPSFEESVAEYDQTHPNLSEHRIRDEDGQLLASLGRRLAEETRSQPQVLFVLEDGRCAACYGEVAMRVCWSENHALALKLRATIKPYYCNECGITGDVKGIL
jgi:hypothetical protein